MSWDRQVSSLLSVADGSVAKMRERLGSGGEDLFPSKETIIDSDPVPPTPPSRCQLQRERPLSDSIQWSDVAALQFQLRIQRQEIQSLTQRVITMETERYIQRSLIQKLQEEVQRLGNRRGEEWRTEVVCELSSLRGQLTGATFLGNLEDSLSSKLQHQRSDIDLVKTQLRVQEEELLHLQKETRESRRQGQHTCRTVEQMTESFKSHSCDMTKSVSDTHREVQQIRSTVSQLKEEIRTLREPLLSAHTPGASPLLSLPRRGLRPEVDSDMDSDDLSLTPSLDEVSSDDLSWTDHRDPTDLHHKHLRDQSGPSHRSTADPHLQDEKEDDDDDDDDDDNDDDDLHNNIVNLDVVSDLSLNDL